MTVVTYPRAMVHNRKANLKVDGRATGDSDRRWLEDHALTPAAVHDDLERCGSRKCRTQPRSSSAGKTSQSQSTKPSPASGFTVK